MNNAVMIPGFYFVIENYFTVSDVLEELDGLEEQPETGDTAYDKNCCVHFVFVLIGCFFLHGKHWPIKERVQ